MITRGILCNILVCLAVWCSIKMQSEAAKLIMILWCIFLFMMCGFEHSIANMSIIGVGLLHPLTADATISVNYYITDLFFVTLGNMIGGIVFVALPITGSQQKTDILTASVSYPIWSHTGLLVYNLVLRWPCRG